MVTSWIAGTAVLPAWLARSEALRAWARGAGLGPRRIAMTVAGLLLVSGGLVMAPLPLVGLLLLAFGIGVLAVEYAWARRALAGLRGAWEAAGRLGAKRRAKGGTGS
jgi:hypothetical protein